MSFMLQVIIQNNLGDLLDPHKTHRRCLDVIMAVINTEHKNSTEIKDYKSLVPGPENIYFYRGAW